MPIVITFIHHKTEAKAIWTKEEITELRNWKNDIKLSYVSDNMIVYSGNSIASVDN